MKIFLLVLFINPSSMGVAMRVELSDPSWKDVAQCEDIARYSLSDFVENNGYSMDGDFIVAHACYAQIGG